MALSWGAASPPPPPPPPSLPSSQPPAAPAPPQPPPPPPTKQCVGTYMRVEFACTTKSLVQGVVKMPKRREEATG